MQPPALRALLTINAGFYLLWVVALMHIDVVRRFVWMHLALNPDWPAILTHPWQLVTYNFLHLQPGFWGLIHILFNMLWLVWIGREYEELHGSHRLLALYVIAGVGGGLLTVVLHMLFPGVGAFGGLVHGASASVLGVLMAVAILYPFKSVALFLLGPIRLLYLVLIFLALDVLFMAGGGTAVGAHLGGALFGLLYAKAEQRGIELAGWARVFFQRRRARRRQPVAAETGWSLRRVGAWMEQRRGSAAESRGSAARERSLEEEVDRILDKISAHGYDSLTEEEKRILYEASRR
ncbi:Membrane associated serine protease, rhomboid family [Rhodothermus profundi]|uniref:Membrane associated serine protease, rhomboid family n=2 Tax=Rhodothermus profundi TaxID=633813 RepID=A0A1M6RPY6_9BACT|nr:Membrane associated serine protease, rhomboid family [Rhodothermus profundi]